MKPRILTAALMAAGLCTHGAPAAADIPSGRWTVTDIGNLGGDAVYAAGINDSGLVVGGSRTAGSTLYQPVEYSYASGTLTSLASAWGVSAGGAYAINSAGDIAGAARIGGGSTQAVLYSGGTLTALGYGSGGANYSYAYGINASGTVVGEADTFNAGGNFLNSTGFVYSQGTLTPLGGAGSGAYGVNASGQVVGQDSQGHAFIYSSGSMQDLGTLSAGTFSYANAINDAGVAVGVSYLDPDLNTNHAFAYSNGAMTDLGTLGGLYSNANAINGAGFIVGNATTAGGDQHAVLWQAGKTIDLNSVAPAGWTLTDATGINNFYQIVGTGIHNGVVAAYVITLQPDWQGGSGNWDDAAHWNVGGLGSVGYTPNTLHDVLITSADTITVKGSGNASVRSLTVNGAAGQLVTFDLAGGQTTTANGAFIGANGLLTGSGQLGGPLTVQTGGVLQVNGSQTMQFTGPLAIEGTARVYGGGGSANLLALAPVTIASNGQLNLQGANLDLRGGLIVNGQLNASFGGSNISGPVTLATGARVVLSGNSGTAFYDAVALQSGAEFRVSAGATATFFGAVTASPGALLTGTGGKYFEGGLVVGSAASSGQIADAGSVTFGASNTYLAVISGEGTGSYDKYIVAGQLALGGTLKLASSTGFVAQAGQTYDLLSWGSEVGRFDSIDTSGLLLAPGTQLDISQLYTTGEITVAAVPEPATLAMWLTGMSCLLCRSRWRPQFSRSFKGAPPCSGGTQ